MSIRRVKPFLWALLISAAVLFFCSKSSPAYPVNDWSDANIYFTIGRGMAQGKMVYRDLYDHKGPLLYALHALCALVCPGSFLGVYGIEVLWGAWFLMESRRFMEALGAKKGAAEALLPVLAVVIYSSFSFAQGDSAEELCLPMMMTAAASVCAFAQSGEKELKTGDLLLNGFLVGCVFWTKFTLVGVQAGFLGWVLARHLCRREGNAFLRAAGLLVAGFALSTLPWVIYFGLGGAIGDWLKVYLYDNLFLYSAGESAGLAQRAKAMVFSAFDWFLANLRYTLCLAGGLIWMIRHRACRWPVWLGAGLGGALVFMGGKSYAYYGLALAGFTAAGLAFLAQKTEKWLNGRTGAVVLALCVALCPLISHNMTADYGAPAFSAREDTMQYRIAAQIPPDASLLNYGFMDAGFFTAAGVVPQVKYFHQTNVPLEEMLTEQARYVKEGLCDYVVTRGQEPEGIEQYERIAECESPDFWYEKVVLYRRRDGV